MSLERPRMIGHLLNYRLARLLSSSGAVTLKLCEGKYGITRREWRLIGLLAAGGPMSPSELAQRLNVDRARVSRCISELVAKQLLKRTHSGQDRRRCQVCLTPGGQNLYRRLFPESVALNKRILQVLSARETALLDRLLALLTRSADDVMKNYPVEAKADRRHGGSRRSLGRRAGG